MFTVLILSSHRKLNNKVKNIHPLSLITARPITLNEHTDHNIHNICAVNIKVYLQYGEHCTL